MRKTLLILPSLLAAGACSTTPVLTPPPARSVPERAEEGKPPPERLGAEGGEHRKHAVNLFLGGNTNQDEESGFAAGLDYEYKFTPEWGAGAFAEGVTGDLRSFAGGVLAFYHPIEPLALVAGPGLEREPSTDSEDAEWSAILRVGGFYEFPLSKSMVIAPAIYYDFAEGVNTLVYGINLGTSF